MKIALAQCNLHIGNFAANERKIADYIRRAKTSGADLVVFPEMSVCGYPPADFLEFGSFVEQCYQTALRLTRECKGIGAIVGLPVENPAPEGKNLYNAAFLLYEGDIIGSARKTLLPNYDIFDEYRYFEPNTSFSVIPFRGERIALTICEDLWDVGDDQMYTRWPMEELRLQKPTLMVNIAASPFHHEQAVIRESVLRKNAERYHLPLIYVNQVGAQTELIFDGGSLAMNPRGEVVLRLPAFEEGLAWIDTHTLPEMKPLPETQPSKMEACHKALV
ncbi:MAG TPA: nitrilase-related carbon-nitrogen hydrolase, partial [Bacteroidales bacterium]|nr:nitrilase-related carbon-nitrogen hydrolase [Bacteroidales bacterium]